MRPFPGPRMRGPAGRCLHRPVHLGVQCSLFLGRGECPGGTRAALLAELEAQLARRRQLGLGGAEGGTGLGEIQGTEQIATEVALIACDLACGSLALLRHRLPFDRLD
jgi:hypothetical protein